ncbi:MAG: polysaccharide deacetylase family protein [Polyangiaceae bacterium]
MPPGRVVVYLATFGVLVMAMRALLVGPPPLFWSASVTEAYVGLLMGAVMVLRWRVFVDAVVRGPPGSQGVALTFDDGPHPKWTPRILAILEKRGVKATFFVVARKAEQHPQVVRAILDAGHTVGLHSYAHDRLFALRRERRVREDLERGLEVLEKITGSRPLLFRPPIGHTNPAIARVVDKLDLTVVGWNVAGRDGLASSRVEDVVARVRRDLADRAIVLLHDAPERGDREPAAVKALPAILDAIASEQLDVVPLAPWVEG